MTYELASPEWFAALHAATAAALAALARDRPERAAGLSYSMCEVCTDPPEHIGRGHARVGWHCVVENGVLVRFEPEEADVQFKIVAEYETMLKLSRYRTDGLPERWADYSQLTGAMATDGRLQFEGVPASLPREFGRIHDLMARLTA